MTLSIRHFLSDKRNSCSLVKHSWMSSYLPSSDANVTLVFLKEDNVPMLTPELIHSAKLTSKYN